MSTHTCHHPFCEQPCPPRMFACRPHWASLPKRFKDAIWASYSPGQERRMDPSREYLDAARAAVNYWRERDSGVVR